MNTKGNGATTPLEESVSGIGAPAAVADSLAPPLKGGGVDGRMRAELEQAHVAIEDMNDRIAELTNANEVLAGKLQQELRLREETERDLLRLRSEMPTRKPDDTEKQMLRHELSMAIEELQIMQEELQAAHDELGQRSQASNIDQVSDSLAK